MSDEGGAAAELLERLVAACWTEVLGIDDPAADQSFFELGGSSIQGLELTGRLAELLPFESPLVALFFEGPTIRELARAIAAEASADELALLRAAGGPA